MSLEDDILKCLRQNAEELKKTALCQQNLLKKMLANFKKFPNFSKQCCPMCETVFDMTYEEFENHVISHFQPENNSDSFEFEKSLSIEIKSSLP